MAKSDGCSQCKVINSELQRATKKLDEMKKQVEAFKTLANKKNSAAYSNMVDVFVQNCEEILEGTNTTSDAVQSPNAQKDVGSTSQKVMKRKMPVDNVKKTPKDVRPPKVLRVETPQNKKYLLKSSVGITTLKRPVVVAQRLSSRARRRSYKDFITPNGPSKKQKTSKGVLKKKLKDEPVVEEQEEEEEEATLIIDRNSHQSNLNRSRRTITPNKKYTSFLMNPSITKKRKESTTSSYDEQQNCDTPNNSSFKRGRGRPKKNLSSSQAKTNGSSPMYVKKERISVKKEPFSDSEQTPIKIKSEPRTPTKSRGSGLNNIPVSATNEIKVIKLTNSRHELNKVDNEGPPELVVFVRNKRSTAGSTPTKFL